MYTLAASCTQLLHHAHSCCSSMQTCSADQSGVLMCQHRYPDVPSQEHRCVNDYALLLAEVPQLASSSSNSFLGTDEAQTTSSTNSALGQAVASYPLSFLMSNCSALQGLDQQVLLVLCCAHAVRMLCCCQGTDRINNSSGNSAFWASPNSRSGFPI